MSTAVTKYPGAIRSATGWSNFTVARLGTDDASYATVGLSQGETSDVAQANAFGFAIPEGSTILSVLLEVEWYAGHADYQKCDIGLAVVGAASWVGIGQNAVNKTSPYVISQLAGSMPTPAQLNSSDLTASVTALSSN